MMSSPVILNAAGAAASAATSALNTVIANGGTLPPGLAEMFIGILFFSIIGGGITTVFKVLFADVGRKEKEDDKMD
jgi:hypothetical protein